MQTSFTLSLSWYWLLVPLVIGLAAWVRATEREDRGGYFSGFGTFLVFCACLGIFFLLLAILLAVHLYRVTHP